MRITIDASVFVAAARPSEARHAESRDFLRAARASNVDVVGPVLLLPECSAAVMRRTGNAELVTALLAEIEDWPELRLVTLTKPRARRAARLAAQLRLRGADAIYVATAKEFDATFITWDNEVLQRSAAIITALTPDDWLAPPISSSQPQ